MWNNVLLFGAGAFMAWLFLREPMVEDHFKAASDHLEKAKRFTEMGDSKNAWLNTQEAKQHMELLNESERIVLKQEFGTV